MKDLLITVYIPAAGTDYDVFIPRGKRMAEIAPLILNALSGLVKEHFSVDGGTIICRRDTGEPIDISMTPEQLGIKAGSELMIV
jgi:hypothetical protein